MTKTGKNKVIKIRTVLQIICMVFVIVFAYSYAVFASDNGLPADYVPNKDDNRDLSGNVQNKYGIPWHQFKNILTDETVSVPSVDVEVVEGYGGDLKKAGFIIYNSTTQETETVVYPDASGKLDIPPLKRGHTYILMLNTDRFIIDGGNVYVWALAAGDQGVASGGAYEHKKNYVRLSDNDPVPANYLRRLTEIDLKYDPTGYRNPRYYSINNLITVNYKGKAAPNGVRIRLTSDGNDPVTAVTENGRLNVELIEDTDYTVHVDDGRYTVDTFALTIKDKSEHKFRDSMTGAIQSLDKYTYDHTCCQGVSVIELKDRTSTVDGGKVSSLKKYKNTNIPQTTVRGMDFKTLLLLVRYPKISLPAGSGVTDYDAVELTLANPHRWEKCKITDHTFTVTQMLPQQRTVKNVYLLANGVLKPLAFTQSNKESVEFKMDSMSLYNVIIEYLDKEPESKIKAPVGTSIRKLKGARKKFTVTWKKRSGVKGYQIQYSTKKNFKKAKTVTVKGAKKTKKTIKKLKSRKRYYVRIRTYKTVNGKKHYSKWSKAKSVKVR